MVGSHTLWGLCLSSSSVRLEPSYSLNYGRRGRVRVSRAMRPSVRFQEDK